MASKISKVWAYNPLLRQNIRSARPAAEGRELNIDVAHFLIENPAAYAAALLPLMR